MKKVRILPGCISCGTCQVICPEVFEVTDISYVKANADLKKNEDAVRQAAQMCPVSAIEIEED
jgi:ferredoxin